MYWKHLSIGIFKYFFPLDTKRVLPRSDCADVNDHVLCHFHRVYFSFERLWIVESSFLSFFLSFFLRHPNQPLWLLIFKDFKISNGPKSMIFAQHFFQEFSRAFKSYVILVCYSFDACVSFNNREFLWPSMIKKTWNACSLNSSLRHVYFSHEAKQGNLQYLHQDAFSIACVVGL